MVDGMKSEPKLNFGLTEEQFIELLNMLMSGNEQLFERIFVSQAADCIKNLQRRYGATYENAYDTTMDTLIGFRRGLIMGKFKYGNLRALFNLMAKHQLLKKRNQNKERSEGDMELFEIDFVEFKYESSILSKLKLVWSQLDQDEKKMLHLHYNLGAKLVDIAQNLGLKEEAVRKRKQRILTKIRSKLSN